VVPEHSEMAVDPSGDLFGNYMDYGNQDFRVCDGPLPASDNMNQESSNTYEGEEEEEDMDEEDLAAADNEQAIGLEPERPCQFPVPDMVDNDGDSPAPCSLRLRGGAEEGLTRKPFVVRFPNTNAGQTHYCESDTNDVYSEKLSNPENAYAQFSSQMDWEIARWAKLSGLSSTAFTELMKIDSVSAIIISGF